MISYCVDVGSVRSGAFGWARAQRDAGVTRVNGGPCIAKLVDQVVDDLERCAPTSLGIESPLFLPIPRAESDLSSGRDGERDRSCFAPTGGYVTTLGLHELAYILRQLKARVPDLRATLDWTTWKAERVPALLVWEAFVSGSAHTSTDDHVQDAATAATKFLEGFDNGLSTAVTVKASCEIFSMAGAALLWADLASNVEVLRQPTLVVKPSEPWSGDIERQSGSDIGASPVRRGRRAPVKGR